MQVGDDASDSLRLNSAGALAFSGGTARAIGREHTNPLNRTRVATVRGFMPTCTARKAIRATRHTGIAEQASPFAESHWMRSGSAS
jgi:hypothetical protein